MIESNPPMTVDEAQVGQALRVYPEGLENIFSDKVATVTRINKKSVKVTIVGEGCTMQLDLGPKVKCEVIK